MKKYYEKSFRTRTSVYAGAVEQCGGCSMQVIKFYEGRATTPQYAVFLRQDDKGWLLINTPTSARYEKREARWLDPANIRVEWIRAFTG